MWGNGIEDEQLVDIVVALSMHPHLKKLKLSGNQVGRNTCIALATLVQWAATELSELYLADNAVGDEGIELLAPALAKSTSLKVLCLSRNGISPKGIQALSSVLQSSSSNLEKLILRDDLFGDDGAKIFASSLANNVSLKALDLGFITDEGWKQFTHLLCDSSSVNKTYLSNHTLKSIVTLLLNYNGECDKKKVAVKKIIKTHKDISMQPFFEWDLKILPIAVEWFNKAVHSSGVCHEHVNTKNSLPCINSSVVCHCFTLAAV